MGSGRPTPARRARLRPSTTIKSILGLVEPTDGRVSVNGVNPHETPAAAYRHVSAVLEGARNIYWRLTVRENLRYFAGLQGVHPNGAGEEIDRLLSLVALEEKADEEVRGLSRGMQQNACLACALGLSLLIRRMGIPEST